MHPLAEAEQMTPFTDLARDINKQHHDIAMRMLTQARKRMSKADDLVQQASLMISRQGEALTRCDNALWELKQGQKEVEQAKSQAPPNDQVLDPTANQLLAHFVKRRVDVHLHEATIYIGRDSINQATNEVRIALELDPESKEALTMKSNLAATLDESSYGDPY